MAWAPELLRRFGGDLHKFLIYRRLYSSKVDLRSLKPMILKRIRNRANFYPVESMIPVAEEVLSARRILRRGVASLLQVFPVKACQFCPEVFIGKEGHQIKTCNGSQRHSWVNGQLNDVLVPVEAFHLNEMFQEVIKHDQRFTFDRVPAVVELCSQAGVEISPEEDIEVTPPPETEEQVKRVAEKTLEGWETLRTGVQRLLLVYPAKVCKYCSEVHIGPSGHKARLCGVFKFEKYRGSHFWTRADVDSLVPPRMVWHRRRQDPEVLVDSGRGFYGHAPAVVELCSQGGAVIPKKYFQVMKIRGLSRPLDG